jgi:uncharacterized membrane protein
MADESGTSEGDANKSVARIEKKLIETNPHLFDGIPKDKRQQIIRSLVFTIHKTHIGPLPDIETLAGYSNLIPNGAERVMRMAEKQSEHRMKMEEKVITGQLSQSNTGQILAFLIGLAALGASAYCIVSGYEWAGAAVGVGGITGLVTAFIKGRSAQERDLSEKKLK